MSDVVFPPLERVRVPIPPDLRPRFDAFIHERGWTPEEGVRILLAYGADTQTTHIIPPEETYNEWAADRAELAVLRHRAYIAYEAIRSLQMNITGLGAKNQQFERSIAMQQARQERLRRALADLEGQLHYSTAVTRNGGGRSRKRIG